MTITVVDSNTVAAVTEAVALKVNSNVPNRLASFFYINKKNKISYYRKDAWGSLETWNAGSNTWEYSPGMNDATLIKLPANAFKTHVAEANVEVTKVTTSPLNLTSSISRTQPIPDINNLSNRHPILQEEERRKISERAKELAKIAINKRLTNPTIVSKPPVESLPTVINNLTVLEFSLAALVKKHNIHNYPTHFVEGENNYAFAYIFEKGLWEKVLRLNYIAGAITVTSKVCAEAVIKELNDLGIKSNQI